MKKRSKEERLEVYKEILKRLQWSRDNEPSESPYICDRMYDVVDEDPIEDYWPELRDLEARQQQYEGIGWWPTSYIGNTPRDVVVAGYSYTEESFNYRIDALTDMISRMQE